ncbi:uncharacterized protein G2W53_010012 [Senna tora]|uniref:Uncharacterized protein n=1 Tax=Senna tora TaxID=362788 RepID=A0A834X0A5_9FABA|nr:uncharacterized protein G2W53_010012 [Senna tora]
MGERGSCLNIFRTTITVGSQKPSELRGKRHVAQVSQTRRFRVVFANRSVFMLRLESSWHGRSVDHVLTYSRRQSQPDLRNLHELRGKRLVAQVIKHVGSRCICDRSGFDAPIGVVLAWEERGPCLNIFWTTNRGRISETIMNYEAKDMLRSESNVGSRCIGNRSGFNAPIESSWHGRSVDHVLNIRTTNRGRISETFTNYEAKDLFAQSVDHVLNIPKDKSRRILETFTNYEAKDFCAVSQTRRFALYCEPSGFHPPIGVVLEWEERGSCLNIFRTTNRGRISESFTNYEAKDLLRKSVDHVLTYSGRQIAVGSQKPSTNYEAKTCCASESNTSVREPHGFDAPIGVVLAWEERGSCLNIFRTTNRVGSQKPSRIMSKDLLRKSVDHFLTYLNGKSRLDLRNLHELRGKRLVAQDKSLSDLRNLHEYEAKTCCASESNTSIRVVFANRSGFDAPIGVVSAWEERGSCLNIFQTTNRGQISETFTNYEAKDLLRKSVDHVLTYPDENSRSDLRTFTNYEAKTCAQVSQHVGSGCIRERSGFDAPIGVVFAWEERDHVLTYSVRQIAVGFRNLYDYEAKDLLRKNLHELRGKRLVAQVSQTRRFANRSAFDAPRSRLGMGGAWNHVLNIPEDKSWSDPEPSRITRQKTCCASESNSRFALYSRTEWFLCSDWSRLGMEGAWTMS